MYQLWDIAIFRREFINNVFQYTAKSCIISLKSHQQNLEKLSVTILKWIRAATLLYEFKHDA
jgi:hypothetical protein